MGAFGLFVIARVAWSLRASGAPEPLTMGAIGCVALVVNGGVALMLYRFRFGDANMRSVWICSRNDALGNVAVVPAGLCLEHGRPLARLSGGNGDGAAGAVRLVERAHARADELKSVTS